MRLAEQRLDHRETDGLIIDDENFGGPLRCEAQRHCRSSHTRNALMNKLICYCGSILKTRQWSRMRSKAYFKWSRELREQAGNYTRGMLWNVRIKGEVSQYFSRSPDASMQTNPPQ